MSSSMFETFGNEKKYEITAGTVRAYLENSTIKFPLPEASAEILGDLVVKESIDLQLLEQVTAKLVELGFKKPKANTMAQVLLTVAESQEVNPLTYFDYGAESVKLTQDGYVTMNLLRPTGNRVGLTVPKKNSNNARYKELIQP